VEPTTQAVPISKGAFSTGRIITILVVLFMLFDSIAKILKAQQVVDATARIGFSVGTIVGIGTALRASTVLYVTPRTSILGAILLTAYRGGATAANVWAATRLFNTAFPVMFGILAWWGLYLRDSRLRALIPLRT
jgi:multisubunit Na+/H+ antiporter MnhB subunit